MLDFACDREIGGAVLMMLLVLQWFLPWEWEQRSDIDHLLYISLSMCHLFSLISCTLICMDFSLTPIMGLYCLMQHLLQC